ncbi:MAG: hypothetical protein JXB49_03430 [Bacteroidales bacterium]|nr:hypothetical protein [Bacteroidales bacterium]
MQNNNNYYYLLTHPTGEPFANIGGDLIKYCTRPDRFGKPVRSRRKEWPGFGWRMMLTLINRQYRAIKDLNIHIL